MTDPIVRVYESEQQARDAANRLKEEGFSPDEVYLVTPLSGEEVDPAATVSSALLAGRVLGKQAQRYAQFVEGGHSFVAVLPPFGYAQLAMNILAEHGPIETEPRPPQRSSMAWDEGAPFSSAFQLRTIQRNQPAPFSSLLGLGTVSRGGRSFFATLFGELTDPHFALFGRSSLSSRAAPLSSLVGLKTLSGRSGPSWRSSFGLPMLTSGSPYSLGLPLLSRNPAPLSSLFGLRVLSRYQ